MANRYWVGGTGSWNTTLTTNWSATSGGSSGASAPTISDSVFIDINSGSGTITLTSNVSVASIKFEYGTLNLSTYRLTAGTFDSSNSNTRTIDFGSSGVIQVTGSGSAAFNCATSTNLTISNTLGQKIQMTSASAKTFAGGSKTWPGIWNIGNGALTITGSNSFNGTFEASVPATYLFEAGSTQTFILSLYLSGTSTSGINISSTVSGSQATLSQSSGGNLDINYVTIKDIIATGGQTWLAKNSIDAGNNTGWIISVPTKGSMMMFC